MFRLGKILFIAILACLTSCSSDDGDEEFGIRSYSVPQVPLDIEKERLVLVDSEAELNRIFAGHTEELLSIDFSTSKLLLIHGSDFKQVKAIILDSFYKYKSDDYYSMIVRVEAEDIDKDCYWTAAYLVPRRFNTPIGLCLSITYGYVTADVKMFFFNKKEGWGRE